MLEQQQQSFLREFGIDQDNVSTETPVHAANKELHCPHRQNAHRIKCAMDISQCLRDSAEAALDCRFSQRVTSNR